jgi:hypothetical protein
MFECKCGKKCAFEKGFTKHKSKCEYVNLDISKIYHLGYMIDEIDKILFRVKIGEVKKLAVSEKISNDEAKKILREKLFYKYRKSFWDIHLSWKDQLLVSEHRPFLKWVWDTYSDISLISLKSLLGNSKVIYRYNLENTTSMISKRIDDSLIHIHEVGSFNNDFEFVDCIMTGKISMYYVLFNDWLAITWFASLDKDLQDELADLVEIASKTVLEKLNADDFDNLQKQACAITPIIYTLDF